MIENEITAIVVVYNTPVEIANCINSLKSFYKGIRIVIVDNSPKNSECFFAVKNLSVIYNGIKVINTYKNIGHGMGLNRALSFVQTEWVLVMDSDTITLRDFLYDFKEKAQLSYFGAGLIVNVDNIGHNVDNGIPYLHPHYALIRKSRLIEFGGFNSGGAPFLNIAKQLNRLKLDEDIFYNYNLSGNIIHEGRATVNVVNSERKVKYH